MLSRSESKGIRALGNRKDREAQGLFLAEGVRVVEELNDLADTSTNQGVVVVAEIPPATLDGVPDADRSTVLILDGVQDPGNVGTLIRSAAAFGCSIGAYLPGTVDPWNPKAVRASAGAVFRLPVVPGQPETVADWLNERGYLLLGADAAGRPVDRLALSGRTALVVGNEGGGLSGFVRSRVDSLVAVPMAEAVESLNVAVAAGILLYLVTRKPV